MNRASIAAITLGLLALPLWGCSSDYGDQRPDAAQLSPDDSGLQSKDVIACTNQLVSDLLSSQQLNSSPTQWTLVVTGVQDETIDHMFATNYDIFTESLRSAISEKAQGALPSSRTRQPSTICALQNWMAPPTPTARAAAPTPPRPKPSIRITSSTARRSTCPTAAQTFISFSSTS